MSAELKHLARRLFDLVRGDDIWIGGRIEDGWKWRHRPHEPQGAWPQELERPQNWEGDFLWTLSPEVTIGAHRYRICISSYSWKKVHGVRVFVDDQLKYPGGFYIVKDGGWHRFWRSVFSSDDDVNWSSRIARIERADGGKTGPVDNRQLVIDLIDAKVSGVDIRADYQARTDAEEEVEDHLERHRRLTNTTIVRS